MTPDVSPAAVSRPQLAALAALAMMALAASVVLPPALFARFLGPVAPPAAMAGAMLAGGLALAALHRRGLAIAAPGALWPGLIRALLIGAALVVPAVLIDLVLRFPRDINLAPLAALAFYPAMGLLVEALFHAFPAALLLTLLAPGPGRAQDRRLTLVLGLTALIEPAFQMALAADAPVALTLATGAQVLAVNLAQLALLRRHGALPMIALRLVYYLGWHILWGQARLALLF